MDDPGSRREKPGIAARGGGRIALSEAALGLRRLWPERPGYAERLEQLRTRLEEERLQIAVLGQFKRGKSSFLNALLGIAVLPTGVVPLTAIATFLRWAERPALAVTYTDNRPAERLALADTADLTAQLFRLVTEEGNPHNRAGVAHVEAFLPAPVLEGGIVLIDTPGIGSTLRHNTEAALAVLPECDAGFFVLSADPPVTAAELDYLERVRPHVTRLFFVLNKIDYLDADERRSAVAFLRTSLRRHAVEEAEAPVFEVSARRALAAKERGDGAGVEASGIVAVERHMREFLARDKSAALDEAVQRKARDVLDDARLEALLAVRALELPLADLEQRAERFAVELTEIKGERQVAGDLLAGDRRRLIADLEAVAARLREEARARLKTVLGEALGGIQCRDRETPAAAAIAEAIPEFFVPRMAHTASELGDRIEEILAGHIARAEVLVARVRDGAAALFEIPTIPASGADVFTLAREPYWVTQKWDQTIGTLAESALAGVLPAAFRERRLQARLARRIDDLVERNVENLRWATLQNLEDALRRFAGWFDERLAEAVAATRGALDAVIASRRACGEQAEQELDRLRSVAAWIAATSRQLCSVPSATAPGEPG